MDERMRSGDPPGIVIKNKNSSGCLIVKKKGSDGVGGALASGSRRILKSKKEKKRPRLVLSDSGSSDELLVPSSRRVAPDTIRVCNGLSVSEKGIVEESGMDRKRDRGDYSRVNKVGKNGEWQSERKRDRLDVFEFDEYDGIDVESVRRKRVNDVGAEIGGRRFLESMPVGRNGVQREYMTGSGRQSIEKKKKYYYERTSGFSQGNHVDRIRLGMDREEDQLPISLLRDKYLGDSEEPIRVQGKNGVLKVMVNKNKKVGRSVSNYDQLEAEGNWRGSKKNDTVNMNVMKHPSYSSESRSREKPGSSIRTQENLLNLQKSLSTKKSGEHDSSSEDSDTSLKPSSKNVQACNSTKRFLAANNGASPRDLEDYDMPPKLGSTNVEFRHYKRRLSTNKGRGAHLESKVSNMSLKAESKKLESFNMKKSGMTKYSKGADTDSEDSDTSPTMGPKSVEACYSAKRLTSGGEKMPCSELLPSKVKAGKVRRGSGTEKQKVREQIRSMLLNAGWTIDYRPRRNRDYLDAVYINSSGTAYWSIIKAYDALQKQLHEDDEEAKPTGDGSSFTPLSEEVLSQLTRKTRKKIEKEMKKKQQEGSESEHAEDVRVKRYASVRHKEESTDSGSQEEKLSSFIKHGGKSSKSRVSENGQISSHHLRDGAEIPFSESSSHKLKGQKSRKLGRCTLLIRNSNKGLASETDGFTPYSGKRTLLSWLIDIGSVELSQKVQYKNRRRTKVMLEGWITKDGIHCSCCSKILTVSKFEIHAGSKLRQPFQNIYLDSGMSLLQCQIDAWVKQEQSEQIGFHSVDIDGDDPNDDTCGLCGDGGDLICCDGCPSTFHQICLDIQMLPPGDWHCPYCTCKFCGKASDDIGLENDSTVHALLSCTLCEKKYHLSCTLDIPLPVDSNSSFTYFCGKKCIELSEQIQKYLGVKLELEGGYSWSLIHRMDADSDASSLGLPQRVECNSKLAVALTVMDECFLPIIDRRSGINLLHNVLYNCRSNFNRLNYGGFYTAILERGDEIISAASIRFHGTQLVEMPFIGTRHIYRRQGMFRRLFCAIESALRSLKVEKMIIPAISELTQTWMGVFGFTSLEESLKQELRSMNVLVFPGIDMLQKLLQRDNSEEDVSKSVTQMEIIDKHSIPCVVDNKFDGDGFVGHDDLECDDVHLQDAKGINDRVTAADSDSQGLGTSLSNASEMSNSLDASHELKIPISLEGTFTDSESGDRVAESVLDLQGQPMSVMSYDLEEMENKFILNSSIKFGILSSKEGGAAAMDSDSQCQNVSLSDTPLVSSSVDASNEGEIPVLREGAVSADSESGDKLVESASNKEGAIFDTSPRPGALEIEGQQVFLPHKGENAQSCEEDNEEDGHALRANVAISHELTIPVSLDETLFADSKSGEKSSICAPNMEDKTVSDMSPHALEMKNEPALNSSVEDNAQECNEGNVDNEPELNGNVATSQKLRNLS